jgi:hypothetical protein
MEHRFTLLVPAVAGLVALSGSLVRLSQQVGARPGEPVATLSSATPPRRAALSPSAAALRTARWWRQRAVEQVGRRLEAVEMWDPKARQRPGLLAWEDWQAQMAQDPDGSLHRAGAAVQEAIALARSPAETYRATEVLALIECNRGRHEAELRAARRLVALEPQNEQSLLWLRRAARCNRLRLLEQQIDPGPEGATHVWWGSLSHR